MNNNREINFWFFWEILKPFKIYLLAILIVAFVWSSFIVIKALALKAIIDTLTKGNTAGLFWPVSIYLGGWFFNEFFWRLRDYSIMYLKPYLKKHIITLFSGRMMYYDDAYYQKNNASALIQGIRNLADGVDDAIFFFEEFFTHFILIVGSCVAIFSVNFYFGSITSIWLISWGLLAVSWSRNGHTLAFKIFELRTIFTAHLGDIFSNMPTVRIFNAEAHEKKLTEVKAAEVAELEIKRERMFFGIWIIQGIAFFLVLCIVLGFLIYEYSHSRVTVGDFAMLLELVQTIYLYLFDLAKDLSEISETSGKISQGLELIYKKIPEKIYDKSSKKIEITKGEIIFDHVSFKYQNSDEGPFFANDYIKIPAGATVALVGPSGSGKSTLVKLLLRLLEPQSGRILIDGLNISDYSVESVREYFALVPQEFGLFQRSIKENIGYGSFSASEEEIKNAAREGGAHEFIEEINAGYDSILGIDQGLSGGQKQRIMISRGLLRKAKIFVFDESTSALDVQTEASVLANIKERTGNSTKIIIAHRLKTIQDADLILVCDRGRIVEQGTHKQLMENNGLYASLSRMI